MRLTPGQPLRLSPTDLANFHGCRHRTALDLGLAAGALPRPEGSDAMAERLAQLGEEHEERYVASLRAEGLSVCDLRTTRAHRVAFEEMAAATEVELRRGVDVVVQGCLHAGPGEGFGWHGYADVLRRVDTPSTLGAFSYEVYDTKLARETAAGTILQLAVYSHLLEGIQGVAPERFHVVSPDPGDVRGFRVEPHRIADTAAAVRRTRARLLADLGRAGGWAALAQATYPEPVAHCEICRWWQRCEDRRRGDDHLCFIAGIRGHQAEELEERGAGTLALAAAFEMADGWRPRRGSREGFETVRQQATLQVRTRSSKPRVVALDWLPVRPGEGLSLLPEPSPGDVFFDFEGDPFARGESSSWGREYLTGWSLVGGESYEARWAFDDVEEKAAFEAAIDAIMARWAEYPGLHVYHFGHYEPSALKRLMGRHATRAEELDRLLRGERFVNLHRVVVGALRAGLESYSIKDLEELTGFERDVDLAEAGRKRHLVERLLEGGTGRALLPEDWRLAVEGYNRDDCRSTEVLRDWLERERTERVAAGEDILRLQLQAEDAPDAISELEQRIAAIAEPLLEGVSVVAAERDPEHELRWMVAHLMGVQRRELKAAYWEYFRLRDASPDELLDEGDAIAGLEHVGRVEVVKKSEIHRFRYPHQEMNLRRGADLVVHQPGGEKRTYGSIVAVDRSARTVDIRLGPTFLDVPRPAAVFAEDIVHPGEVERSILAFGEDFVERTAEPARSRDDSCGLRLLRRAPRAPGGGDLVQRALALDRDVLAVQGPPGSGKTTSGARMILSLVASGQSVGVIAVSHKVIENLLEAVVREAQRTETPVRVGRKVKEVARDEEGNAQDPSSGIEDVTSNEVCLERLRSGSWNVCGGTAWFWSRAQAAGVVDTLVVDEAGQMSLAMTIAASRAARNLVLLGDPQQLDHPLRASHPEGVGVSALAHLLGDAATMPPERGLFLETTWRLAPPICDFTSELFYDGRLQPSHGEIDLGLQALAGTRGLDGAGLWWHPVEHSGRTSWSDEEIDAIERLVERLLCPGSTWIDGRGAPHPLQPKDLLVVAPFNAQVTRLEERLHARGIRAGTVDRFQGQEAPVVLYSMASSSVADAPRGLEFLLSPNRFNVATSRARCAVFLCGSPRLLDADCRTPRQLELANVLCRYVELARVVEG